MNLGKQILNEFPQWKLSTTAKEHSAIMHYFYSVCRVIQSFALNEQIAQKLLKHENKEFSYRVQEQSFLSEWAQQLIVGVSRRTKMRLQFFISLVLLLVSKWFLAYVPLIYIENSLQRPS